MPVEGTQNSAVPDGRSPMTVRVSLSPEAGSVTHLTAAAQAAHASVVALDVTDASRAALVVDVTLGVEGDDHRQAVLRALDAVEGAAVLRVSDRVFLAHLGGKIEVTPRVPLRNRDDLSLVYTPGVARVSRALAETPADARNLTSRGNSVAIVTDGTAVLGLGDIGPVGALPVMEGKAALFKRFAGIDAWPLCLDADSPERVIDTVTAIAPTFGAINIEDIAAPACFTVVNRLREKLSVPVFHDDQQGTAIVVFAALVNALRVVGKELSEVRVVLAGAGAAGTAITRLLLRAGVEDISVFDKYGAVLPEREGMTPHLTWLAEHTRRPAHHGSIRELLTGADVFIGVSVGGVLDEGDVAAMADRAIVFALANPDPEIDPETARRHAAVVATGRSDYPNQINNVLVFPGVFRGLLDARATKFTTEMALAAGRALAATVPDAALGASLIMPSVFDPAVVPAVAGAVRDAAR